MRFRFSLKWLLAAMVYAAVAAAAFGHGHWAYADLLWIATIAAFGYAVILVCIARGPRQAHALGFVILTVCYLICLLLVPDGLPTARLLVALGAAGDEATANGMVPGSPQPAALATWGTFQSSGTLRINSYVGSAPTQPPTAFITAMPNPAMVGQTYLKSLSFPLQLRSANAIGALAAGLLGILLASLAFGRQSRPASQTSP